MKKSISGEIAPNTTLESSEVNYPRQVLEHKGLYQYVMSVKQVLTINGKRVFTVSDLIGLYDISTEEWKFVAVSNNTLERIQQLIPEISLDLGLNPQSKPRHF